MSSLLIKWKKVKSKFEQSNRKKPAVMVTSWWRQSSGLEPCFKKLDDLYEEQPVEGLEADFEKIRSKIESIDMKQSKLSARITKWLIWYGKVSEAEKKLCVTAGTYEKLCRSLKMDAYLRVFVEDLKNLVGKAEKKFDSFKDCVVYYKKMQSFVKQLSDIDTRAAKEVGLLNKAMKPIIKIKNKWKPPGELVWPSGAAKIREEAETCRLKVDSVIETQFAEKKSGLFEKNFKSLLALAVERESLVEQRPSC